MNQYTLKIPTEKMLELMVYEEEKIRMSKEYQDECTRVKDIPNGWLDVSIDIQKRVAKKFGFNDDISCDIACNMLRRARYIYPNNDIFKKVPVYVRENKANEGKFKVDDKIIDIKLFDICNQEINISEILKPDILNVIVSSSSS